MAILLPPTPVGVPPGHSFWNDWYEKLRQIVNNGNISVLWANINFAGSDISNIAARGHNNLQSIQGGAAGEYNHLTNAEYLKIQNYTHNTLNSIQGGVAGEYYHLTLTQQTRVAGFISAAADPTAANIASGQWALYKNTTSGLVKLWANDGGTLKSVTLT